MSGAPGRRRAGGGRPSGPASRDAATTGAGGCRPERAARRLSEETAMTSLPDRPNTALLVVDVQNDVVAGAYHRDEVIANINTLVDRARDEQVSVIWVQH